MRQIGLLTILLTFLAFLVLSIVLVINKQLSRINSIFLLINWAAVLLGNLLDPIFQRLSILLLAFSYLPFVVKEWHPLKEL